MVRGPNRGLTFLTRLRLVRDPVKKKKRFLKGELIKLRRYFFLRGSVVPFPAVYFRQAGSNTRYYEF
jgi:hypothetical protein